MAYFDNTSAFGPGKPGRIVAFVGEKSKKDKEAAALNRAIEEVSDRLIDAYKGVLSTHNITKARMACFGRKSVEEYERFFLSNILFDYRIWEVDHTWLDELQTLIEKHNPEWSTRFHKDKEFKYSRLK